jgi:hypothetical protein
MIAAADDRISSAPQHARGELAAAHVALVDDVVVQQRSGVHELDGGSELDVAVAGVAGEHRHGEGEHRPQPLAAGVDEVVRHLGDHGDLRPSARQDRGIHPVHVGGHQIGEGVDQRGRMTFKRNDDGQRRLPLPPHT